MRRILITDDNYDAAFLAARLLAARGYETSTASDGETALAMIAEQPPDCLLLDVRMPGMSGLEVLERLKSNPATATIPVILFTAKTQDEDVLDGYHQGADYYIPKPSTAAELVYGVRLVLGELEQEAETDPN